jgi:hypothetical protein
MPPLSAQIVGDLFDASTRMDPEAPLRPPTSLSLVDDDGHLVAARYEKLFQVNPVTPANAGVQVKSRSGFPLARE